ncbi:hypothetical protein KA047_00400 [Candidatus Saccharibacteria bacterium]|nr:hypothetical protein [Candidatus Saccharibacteria bacterium]
MDTNNTPEPETPVTKTAPPVMDIRAPRPAVADVEHQVTEHGTPDNETETPTSTDVPITDSVPPNPTRTKKPWLLIVITLVVVAAIAVGAWFAFMNPTETDNAVPATSAVSSTQPEEATTPVSSSDVSEVVTELETEVKAIDETADYAESAVSDQSLGL